MQRLGPFCRVLGLASLLLASTGCTYQAALQRLPPAEQSAFHTYSKMMSSAQTHTYLTRETAAARAAYLQEIGLTQRFKALDPSDQEAVRAGYIQEGMNADALRFLWGYPYYTRGNTGHYEYWQYLGSAFNLAARGSSDTEAGTVVIVYLVDNKVEWWLETVPTGSDSGSDQDSLRH